MQTVVFRECEPFLSDFTYQKNPYTSNFKKWLPQVKQMQTQKFRYRNCCVRRTLFKTSSSISCITKMLQMSCKTSATPPSVPPTYKKKPFAHFPYKEIQRREGGGSMVVFYFPASRMRCIAYSISRRKTPTDAWIMMLQLGGSWPKKSQKEEGGGEGCNFPEIFDNRAPLLLCMPCPGFFSIL